MRLAVQIAFIASTVYSVTTYAQSSSLKSPNVSGNVLLLYRNSNFHQEDTDTVRNGLDIQEAELAFFADVDPYSRLKLILGIHPEYELDPTTGKVTQGWVIEPEEAFAESEFIPGVTLKGGKFLASFGKHNRIHTHAFPFAEAPLANSVLLGDEGLNDIGVSAAGLIPLPWFSEITVQYLRGAGENEQFNSPTPGDGVLLGRLANLVEVGDSATIELGASYAKGGNEHGDDTSLTGADLTFRWRPASGGKYQSGALAAEYIDRKMEKAAVASERASGLVVWGSYQFAQRWTALARYETLEVKNSLDPIALPNLLTTKTSYSIVFGATEFSSFRLQYDMAHGPVNAKGKNDEQQILLQANFTIGAHPTHAY